MLNWNDSVICGHKSRVKWVIEFFLVEFLKIRSSREVWTARVGRGERGETETKRDGGRGGGDRSLHARPQAPGSHIVLAG